MRPASCLRALAAIILVAFIHHLLIFHPILSSKAPDDHSSMLMYDVGSPADLTEDSDTISVHDRRGVPVPVAPLGFIQFGNLFAHQPLLNGAADHPPKA